MATYQATPDDYAGWNPTGRNFALIAGSGAVIGLASWLSLHNAAIRPADVSTQLLLYAFAWIGCGLACLMLIATFGSISLSMKARGTVSVTEEGVTRTVQSNTRFLAWADIKGLVPMPTGGVTLVSSTGEPDIVIPRFLDDYRACIAEIKENGVRAIPPSSLNKAKSNRLSWPQILRNAALAAAFSLAAGNEHSHSVRIASLAAAIACMAWVIEDSANDPEQATPRWLPYLIFTAATLYVLWHMAHHW